MQTPPALDHIERTLADAYRKEIDQEENVWRSLPFFAATLALQLAALFQVVQRIPSREGHGWWMVVSCAAVTGLSTVTALTFLACSIFPTRFRYITAEDELLAYSEGLIRDETQREANGVTDEPDALHTLKSVLALQYATAIQNNRQINQRRGLWRSLAGLAMLISVFSTVALVATVVTIHIPGSSPE